MPDQRSQFSARTGQGWASTTEGYCPGRARTRGHAPRIIGLLLAFAAIGVGLVWIRSAQTRAAASMLRMEAERIALRRELWDIETRTARLRAPARIIEAADLSPADLAAPGEARPLRGPATVIAQRP